MYAHLLIVISVAVFLFSHYTHFVHNHSFEHMVAFVGKEHVRRFEHIFSNAHADLWVFGHRKRRSNRLHFGLDVFETFQQYDYKQLLIVYELHDIPLIISDDVIEYKLQNKTVASLWPYLDEWPDSDIDVLSWYKEKGGRSVTIHL